MNKTLHGKYAERLEKENKQLKERINNAIEYIKAMQNSDLIFTAICEKELLEILGEKE